jgi:hypothetical protein
MAASAALGLTLLVAGTSPRAADDGPSAPRDAAECARCHPTEAAAWSRSPHARSRTNPLFVASFKHSRLRWCLDCHAPRLDSSGPRTAGIDCAACHLRQGAVLTSHAPTASGLRAHRMEQVPALATVGACQRCHEFAAPEVMREPLVFTATPMQDTVSEWSRWRRGSASVSCQGCHMAGGNHDLEGGHDVELLRRTVSVDFAPIDGGFSASLRASGAGHAVPTGDPFRRFELEIRSPDAGELLATRRFGRALWQRNDAGWEVRDTAAPPPMGASSSSPPLRFAAPAGGFAWSLVYRADEPGLAAELPMENYAWEVARGIVAAP